MHKLTIRTNFTSSIENSSMLLQNSKNRRLGIILGIKIGRHVGKTWLFPYEKGNDLENTKSKQAIFKKIQI